MRFGAHGPAEGEPIDGAWASAPARNQAGNSQAPGKSDISARPGAKAPRGARILLRVEHAHEGWPSPQRRGRRGATLLRARAVKRVLLFMFFGFPPRATSRARRGAKRNAVVADQR